MFKVIQGDASSTVLTLPERSCRLCVTSPPYYRLRQYLDAQDPLQPHEIGLEDTPEAYVAKLVEVFRGVRRCLTDDGSAFIVIGDGYASSHSGRQGQSGDRASRTFTATTSAGVPPGYKPKDLLGIPYRLAFALQADGWWWRDAIVWHKPNPTPVSLTDRCTPSYEIVLHMAKSERYYFDYKAILQPFADARQGRDGAKARSQRNRGGRTDGFTKPNNIDPSGNGGAQCRNVWSIPTVKSGVEHYATYPPALVERCVLAGSAPGDTVLDPFSGAGTTGMVSCSMARKYVGIELSPKYASISVQRIMDYLCDD